MTNEELNDIEKLEAKFKKDFFDYIANINEVQLDSVVGISKDQLGIIEYLNYAMEFLEFENIKISNFGIVANNKINELSNTFKKLNLSFYAECDKYSETSKVNLISEIIIKDLASKINDASIKFVYLYNIVNFITTNQTNRFEKWEKMSIVGKILTFNMQFNLTLTNYEKKLIYQALKEYEESVDKIWNYDLKDNLVEAIKKYFTDNFNNTKIDKESNINVTQYTIVNKIIPALKQLDLEYMIPEVQDICDNTFNKKSLSKEKVLSLKK